MEKILSEKELDLASYIEHTNLKPDSNAQDIIKLCKEAAEHGFAGVCVPPYHVQTAYKAIDKKSKLKVVTVVGFPFGYSSVPSKVEEAKKAIIAGAHEIDMVMNIAAFKSQDWSYVKNDIESVTTACHLQNRQIKVIIETSFLSEEEIIKACQFCADCSVDFVKTSSGYGPSGATVEAVKLMRRLLPDKIKIKASGGIKTAAFAAKLIEAGANRIGTSNGIEIIS